jgi:uncharacterized protein with von Willebrand factor type A (vWA) domain
MPLDTVGGAASQVQADIRSSFPALVDGSEAVRRHLSSTVGRWEVETATVLDTAFPFAVQEGQLRDWQARLHAPKLAAGECMRAADDYAAFCKLAGHPMNAAFWKSQFDSATPKTAIANKFAADRSIATRLLLAEWQKRMDGARAEWTLREIASRRAALMAQLEKILCLLEELRTQLESLGLDPGILFDLSRGELTAQEIAQFERWARYLAEDKGVRQLCELLGRVRQIALSERIERVKSTRSVKTPLPDIDSREEIIGIRLGRDIENVLPSELALLGDPDTTLLFDLRFVEAGLMCFDIQGMQFAEQTVEIEEERSFDDAGQLGPMVVCIDTSGSMSGMPETIAKAMALFLSAKAREQGRPCYLINFSTGIDTLDLSGAGGMESVLRFLRMSFHGGTDVAPALAHALDTMEQDAYRNADLLVISDFVMSGLPASVLARIDARRLDGNRFHSLVVGECYLNHRLRTLFDNEWVYDPRNGSIHALLAFERNLRTPGHAHS